MLGFFALFYHLQFSQNKNSTRENFGDTAKAHKPKVFINLTEVSATIICATKKPREEKVLLVFRSLSSSEAPRSSSLDPLQHCLTCGPSLPRSQGWSPRPPKWSAACLSHL